MSQDNQDGSGDLDLELHTHPGGAPPPAAKDRVSTAAPTQEVSGTLVAFEASTPLLGRPSPSPGQGLEKQSDSQAVTPQSRSLAAAPPNLQSSMRSSTGNATAFTHFLSVSTPGASADFGQRGGTEELLALSAAETSPGLAAQPASALVSGTSSSSRLTRAAAPPPAASAQQASLGANNRVSLASPRSNVSTPSFRANPNHTNNAQAAWTTPSGAAAAGNVVVSSPPTMSSPQPHEWICHVCGNVNFAGRAKCNLMVCQALYGFPGPYWSCRIASPSPTASSSSPSAGSLSLDISREGWRVHDQSAIFRNANGYSLQSPSSGSSAPAAMASATVSPIPPAFYNNGASATSPGRPLNFAPSGYNTVPVNVNSSLAFANSPARVGSGGLSTSSSTAAFPGAGTGGPQHSPVTYTAAPPSSPHGLVASSPHGLVASSPYHHPGQFIVWPQPQMTASPLGAATSDGLASGGGGHMIDGNSQQQQYGGAGRMGTGGGIHSGGGAPPAAGGSFYYVHQPPASISTTSPTASNMSHNGPTAHPAAHAFHQLAASPAGHHQSASQHHHLHPPHHSPQQPQTFYCVLPPQPQSHPAPIAYGYTTTTASDSSLQQAGGRGMGLPYPSPSMHQPHYPVRGPNHPTHSQSTGDGVATSFSRSPGPPVLWYATPSPQGGPLPPAGAASPFSDARHQ